jgi:CHAD domain-containing protein
MSDETFGKRVRRSLRKRVRRVLRTAPATLERGRDDELHALRIAFKRLRYNLEFAAPAAKGGAAEALALLAAMQARLGAVADAAAFAKTYAALLENVPAGDERRAGIESLIAANGRERERSLDETRTLWSAGSANYPERLAASISAAVGSLSIDDP